RGFWEPEGRDTPEKALAKGDLKFTLDGKRLKGSFVLVRMAKDRDGGKRTNWLLIKHRDRYATEKNGEAVLQENATSVASGRKMEDIAAGKGRKPKPFMLDSAAITADAVWNSDSGLAAEKRERSAPKRKARRDGNASAIPDFIAPQLCQRVARPPATKG